MKRFAIMFSIMICTCVLLFPLPGYAVESSSKISDREIVESLKKCDGKTKKQIGNIQNRINKGQ